MPASPPSRLGHDPGRIRCDLRLFAARRRCYHAGMKTLPSLGALFLPVAVLANGGGYQYGNSKLGSLELFQPKNAEQVEMQTELLEIELGVERARVAVEYTLHNSGKAVTVEAGFPITADNARMTESGALNTPSQALQNFSAAADGEPVKWELKWDLPRKKKGNDPEVALPMDGARVSGWHVFKLPFKSGQSRTFRVTYDTPYAGATASVSEDSHDSVESVDYLFSTAAVWKGPIKSGKVVVRAAHVDADKVKFNLPKRFTRKGDVWTWEFKDFEPTLADDLKIAVHPASQSWGRTLPDGSKDGEGDPAYVDYVKESGRWEMQHRLYKATASSRLPPQGEKTYEAKNVRDYGDRVWAEGAPDDGVGESLTLTLDQPRKVSRIGVRNGYVRRDGSTEELYSANNRVAEFAVSINGGKPFTAPLPDELLKRRLFFIPLPADAPPVKNIRLTIQKVYRGTKYRDTCVSAIRLVTPLEKAPKITPSR
jgi:hypothetical protein